MHRLTFIISGFDVIVAVMWIYGRDPDKSSDGVALKKAPGTIDTHACQHKLNTQSQDAMYNMDIAVRKSSANYKAKSLCEDKVYFFKKIKASYEL